MRAPNAFALLLAASTIVPATILVQQSPATAGFSLGDALRTGEDIIEGDIKGGARSIFGNRRVTTTVSIGGVDEDLRVKKYTHYEADDLLEGDVVLGTFQHETANGAYALLRSEGVRVNGKNRVHFAGRAQAILRKLLNGQRPSGTILKGVSTRRFSDGSVRIVDFEEVWLP